METFDWINTWAFKELSERQVKAAERKEKEKRLGNKVKENRGEKRRLLSYFLTGKDLQSGESFSIKFSADVITDDSTSSAEVYFCTGNSCEYYEQIYSDYGADYDMPDFFALIGIDNGFGKKVLSELTLGWYFEFQDGVLTTCNSFSGNETDYDPIEIILNTSLLPPL
ncbi:hypothetical protein TrVE_jg766 [Triparma verrucosa]|uniref:Uncharacterized protein n=1 Tax=Triparma verrucosa TaxID=1606542 RepID=A0A9W7FC12_9STRA|nr:hypothetical protein TrVE_jg766 [Triparma verrucosa]